MKQTFFIPILILAFSFVAFAQTNETPCQKIYLDAPLSVKYGEVFRVSTVLETSDFSVSSKINWIISKSSGIGSSDIKNKESIDITTDYLEKGGVITIIAFHSDERCEEIAMIYVSVIAEKNNLSEDENPCPKIIIDAIDKVVEGDIVTFAVVYEENKEIVKTPLEWTFSNKSREILRNSKGILEVTTEGIKGGGFITASVKSEGENCQNRVEKRVEIEEIKGDYFSTVIQEYSKIDWNEEKIRLNEVILQMQEAEDSQLWAFINFERKTSQVERKKHLTEVFKYISESGSIDKNRITFFVSESDNENFRYEIMLPGIKLDLCNDCLIIRDKDFDKLEELFQQK